jgi:ribosome recycling factor
MTIKDVEASAKQRMEKAITDLQHAIATIRTGRASLSIFDGLKVDYYGTPTPINQLANLHVPEATLITIQPWEPKMLGEIEKAILKSDVGITPSNDPYSTGWSSTCIASRLSRGSKDGPFGTAQLSSTPSSSRRKS